MGSPIRYEDIPEGFDVVSGYSDIPEGFELAEQPMPPQANMEQPDVSVDILKTVGSNMAEGALSVPMTIPNFVNSLFAGPQLLGRGVAEGVDSAINYGAEKIGSDFRVEPQPRGELWKPFLDSADVVQNSGIAYEPQTSFGKAMVIPSQIAGALVGGKTVKRVKEPVNNLLADQTGKGLPTSIAKEAVPTATDLSKMAGQKYTEAAQVGGNLKSNAVNKWVSEIESMPKKTAQGKLLADALGGDKDFAKTIDVVKQYKGKPLSLQAAQEIDEVLGETIDSYVDRTTGALTKEGKKLLDIQTSLRKTIDNAGLADIEGGKAGFQALKDARRLWSASARMRDIEKIITRASMTDNPATAIKTGFKNLVSNPARMRGYTAEERKALTKAANSGALTDLLRIGGNRLNPIITMATGGGLPATVASNAASMASRNAATKVQVGKAVNAANMVARNAVNPPAAPKATPNNLQLLRAIEASIASGSLPSPANNNMPPYRRTNGN